MSSAIWSRGVRTVTVKLHEALLPLSSVAVAETVVVPKGKRLPDGGTAMMLTEASQESVAETVKGTTAPFEGRLPFTVRGAGQVMTGGVASTTVTVPVHELVAPWLSVTVRATLVAPSGYGPAGLCANVIVSPPSGSKEPLSIEAPAVQLGPAETVRLRHCATGTAFGSQTSPRPSPSPSAWPGFATSGQLSTFSPTPSRSLSGMMAMLSGRATGKVVVTAFAAVSMTETELAPKP